MNFTLAQMQTWLPMAVPVAGTLKADQLTSVCIQAVRTDSRSVVAGDLFVALKGENFDGAAFLLQAQAQGAAAVLFEAAHVQSPDTQKHLEGVHIPAFCVPNARVALGELSAQWRRQFEVSLIGVTGSNGKTTVTQMIAAVLRADASQPSMSTQGNLNNEIGVPLTLFNLRASHRRAVIELGMNHPGEIEVLARYAQPTIGLVNNAQREHLEFMATVEAVARENGAVISALPATGVAVFPADDDYTPLWRALAGARRVITFALAGPADVTGSADWTGRNWQVQAQTPSGPLNFALSVAGRHNVNNALAAAACTLAAGVPLADQLLLGAAMCLIAAWLARVLHKAELAHVGETEHTFE